ncbi:hypothetical protein PtB15_12B340 [Puccinia triticina]|nr:hypothetical protein PtB15_12B340 [Puccinia triticina]
MDIPKEPLLPDLNIRLEDPTLEPHSPVPSMQTPSLIAATNSENELAESITMPSTPEVVATSEARSSSNKRKWESDPLNPEVISISNAPASTSKNQEDAGSPRLVKEKIRSVAVIMEETLKSASPRRSQRLKSSGKDLEAQPSGDTLPIKNLSKPGELPTSEVLPEFFNVYDWNYVKSSSPGESNAEPEEGSLRGFLEFLNNKCKYPINQDEDRFFWIPRVKARVVLTKYQKLKFDFENLSPPQRAQTLRDITLKLSNEKLDLDKYPVFSNLHSKLEAGLKSQLRSDADPLVLGRITSIISHVKQLNKIATFLMITYLSLFKEHPSDHLNTELVMSLLSFLDGFWFDIINPEKSKSMLKDHPPLKNFWNKSLSY